MSSNGGCRTLYIYRERIMKGKNRYWIKNKERTLKELSLKMHG